MPSTPSRFFPALACAAAVALSTQAGCAGGMVIRAERADGLDPSSYRTYHLVAHAVAREESADPEIEATIHEVMRARGFNPAGVGGADLIVGYKVLLSGAEADPGDRGGAAGSTVRTPLPASAWTGGGLQADFVDAVEPDGMLHKVLLVTLQEARTYRTVWIGWSRADVSTSQLKARAGEAVRQIMRRVPSRS